MPIKGLVLHLFHIYEPIAMYAVLQLPRSTYYYEAKIRDNQDNELIELIVEIFKNSRQIYGQRKIKKELEKQGWKVSRLRIDRIWHYICVLVDLYNREIIGHSAGPHKSAELVQRAFASVNYNLTRLEIFHTDRGSEFKNQFIDQALETFGIERSLSEKGTPYDNAVAKTKFKTIKTEFVYGNVFTNQQELEFKLFDYVNWFNNFRLHGSLDYLTPRKYKSMRQIKTNAI